MTASGIVWMVFVVILTFIILYLQREIRKLRAMLSSRLYSSSDKDNEPDNATDDSGD